MNCDCEHCNSIRIIELHEFSLCSKCFCASSSRKLTREQKGNACLQALNIEKLCVRPRMQLWIGAVPVVLIK